jgi:hypothetical protein
MSHGETVEVELIGLTHPVLGIYNKDVGHGMVEVFLDSGAIADVEASRVHAYYDERQSGDHWLRLAFGGALGVGLGIVLWAVL